MAPTGFTVRFPRAEARAAGRRERVDASAALGVPAHTTRLFPFMAPQHIDSAVRQGIRAALADASACAFDFALARATRSCCWNMPRGAGASCVPSRRPRHRADGHEPHRLGTAGLVSVAGAALGNPNHAFGASIEPAALFGASPGAFGAVRYAGAAHLVWLGSKALRAAPAVSNREATKPPAAGTGRTLRDALFVARSNPKTALSCAALLPAFIAPEPATLARTAVCRPAFVAIAAVTDSAWVRAATGCTGGPHRPPADGRSPRRAGPLGDGDGPGSQRAQPAKKAGCALRPPWPLRRQSRAGDMA